MKSFVRFLVVLVPLIFVIAWSASMLFDRLQTSWMERDFARRSSLVFSSVEETLADLISSGKAKSAKTLLNRISRDELLHGVLVCIDPNAASRFNLVSISNDSLNPSLSCERLASSGEVTLHPVGDLSLYIWKFRFSDERLPATIYIFNDSSVWSRRTDRTRYYLFALFVALALVVVMAATFVARWTISRPMRDVGVFLREAIRLGDPRARLKSLSKSEFAPLVRDLLKLIREFEYLRSGGSGPESGAGIWTPDRLRGFVGKAFGDRKLCVISNREPFIHTKTSDGTTKILRPASGLVTGVEPILKACNGLWIAHGSGNADRENVDDNNCLRVPPENPEYELKRVWLSEEEEEGYYYGFSNEGLWPLCHIAHQRPEFDGSDWEQYVRVNQKFAQAFKEQAGDKPAIVLIQDYHFALLPRMIRNISPESLILLFWHIPWPNPEAFGICPWRQEILDGMLGADVLGFHTQFHCNNFMDTLDRFIESRIDREHFTALYHSHECRIRPFPISVAWPQSSSSAVKSIRAENGLPEDIILGVGIDRVDYTKGIPERIKGIRRFAERRPDLAKKFSFIQIGAPSRTHIPAYRNLNDTMQKLVEKTNEEFREKLGRDLIILKLQHYNSAELQPYYEQADICLVSALHDGMNLVAKEFVASRRKETGTLILSQFAGASRELREALQINPYAADDIASKLIAACEMPFEEQRDRMRRMRKTILENNVYKWGYMQLREMNDVLQMNSLGIEFK